MPGAISHACLRDGINGWLQAVVAGAGGGGGHIVTTPVCRKEASSKSGLPTSLVVPLTTGGSRGFLTDSQQ